MKAQEAYVGSTATDVGLTTRAGGVVPQEVVATMRVRSAPARLGAVTAACSGNLVEWFDLHVSGLLAVYLAAAFFGTSVTSGGILDVAGIFAASALVRPLGGWLFGRIADRGGRRRSLVLSALAMCVGSLLIAFAPTWRDIGGWAPVLLLAARLLQGVAVGGEYGTVAAYISEVAPRGRRGFFGSFQYASLIGGQIAALLMVMILRHALGDDALSEWGWRIPFLIGAVAALAALALRLRLQEPLRADAGVVPGAGGMAVLIREHWGPLIVALLLTGGGVLSVFTFGVHARQLLIGPAGLPVDTTEQVVTASLFAFAVLQPLCGTLADRIGRRRTMLAFGLLGLVCTVPLLAGLQSVGGPAGAFVLVTLGLAVTSLYTSASGIAKADLFPPEVRALAVGFASSLASVAFAGSAALAADRLTPAGSAWLFHVYVSAMAALVAVLSRYIPREPA